MIHAEGLSKVYRVPKTEPGLLGSVVSVFRRRFEEVHAVRGISFDIQPGERVGFLGPNGAGKTTALKMLSGLLVPSAGSAEVAGHTPHRRAPAFLKQITLVMGQKQQLLWDLPPRETFAMNRALFDLDRAAWARTVGELSELLELGDLVNRPTRNLSLGERMKCELAAALLHRPRVLFLDEPTIGLDVRMQSVVRRFVAEWNRRDGATVLLTSHYMADVAALCDRVIVIARGQVRYDGGLEELVRQRAPTRRVVVTPSGPVDAAALAFGPFEFEGDRLVAEVPAAEVTAAVDRALKTLPVRDLAVEDPPLEAIFSGLFAESEG